MDIGRAWSDLEMLISTISRLLVIRLKKYSDKKTNATHRHRTTSKGNSSTSPRDDLNSSAINIEAVSNAGTEPREDRSLLGCFLNCAPCKKVTDDHKEKTVREDIRSTISGSNERWACRKMPNEIGKIVKLISIGSTKQSNIMPKRRKRIKCKRN